ncbi:STAS domain-containing protein [Jiangella mangrovi]|uniref:Anti-anti-sigma regulatory factor n=1 Tax=Jiangella mangrovi TaxID=1524084 RepID=A0A7W9LL97_9ACTN|nr:anti-anti-sigma regulatory factor [Jiangella mangrovi]
MSNDVAVQTRDFGGCTILTVPGDLDAASADEIGWAANSVDSRHVVVDLGRAGSVDPSAATALVGLHERVRARGGGVCVVTREIGVRAQLERLVPGSALRCYDQIGDALEASMSDRDAALTGLGGAALAGPALADLA